MTAAEIIDTLAKAICKCRGIDLNRLEPGQYTIPYNADYIGESNTAYDVKVQLSTNYWEPRSYIWRFYGEEAMEIIEYLKNNGLKIVELNENERES